MATLDLVERKRKSTAKAFGCLSAPTNACEELGASGWYPASESASGSISARATDSTFAIPTAAAWFNATTGDDLTASS